MKYSHDVTFIFFLLHIGNLSLLEWAAFSREAKRFPHKIDNPMYIISEL